jgi:hypothetical protein
MACLRNISVDTLHKGETEDNDNNNNNNNPSTTEEMNMEMTGSSERAVTVYQSAWLHFQEKD